MLRVLVLVLSFAALGFSQGLRVIHMANAGVLLDCGGRQVAVDVFFRRGVEGYETLPAALREKLETAQPPFDRIELILATHRHADHYDAESVARYLKSRPRTRFVGSPQTAIPVDKLWGKQVEVIERPSEKRVADIVVKFLRVPHNTPLRDTIENTLHIVTWCGKTVAVTGDAEVAIADFRGLRVEPGSIDILVAPWWFFVGDDGREVVDQIFRPRSVWAVHGDVSLPKRWTAQVRENYPNANIGFADAPD